LEGVSPLRWGLEDVGTPFEAVSENKNTYDCNEAQPDGFLDLTLKFDKQELVAALGDISDDYVILELNGSLKENSGSTQITGEDAIQILKNGK